MHKFILFYFISKFVLLINFTCCWCIFEARGPDNSPVDVISLLKKVFHFIHVVQNASNHGKQHEADEKGGIGA